MTKKVAPPYMDTYVHVFLSAGTERRYLVLISFTAYHGWLMAKLEILGKDSVHATWYHEAC